MRTAACTPPATSLARHLGAQQPLELGGLHADVLERVSVGVAAEFSVRALERRGRHQLRAHPLVAGGEAEGRGLGVEGGVVDQPAEHDAVDAVVAGLGHRQLAAELLGVGAQLLLQGADVVVAADRAVADAGDRLRGEAAADADAEAGEADDQHDHQDPDQDVGPTLAEASEHGCPASPG